MARNKKKSLIGKIFNNIKQKSVQPKKITLKKEKEGITERSSESIQFEEKPEKKEKRFPKISHIKKRAFLTAFSRSGNVTISSELAGIDRRTHTNWLNGDPDYVEAFKDVTEEAADRLEAEARRRGEEGTVKPVFYKGKLITDDKGQVVGIREYSDTLLIVLMKGTKPEKYRDNIKQEITGKDGGPIEVNANDSREQLAGRIASIAARNGENQAPKKFE